MRIYTAATCLCLSWFLLGTAISAQSRTFQGDGVQLHKFKDRVTSANFLGGTAINRLIALQEAHITEFTTPDKLHHHEHLQSLTVPYGFEIDVEDISQLESLCELELGFVGVNSEHVTIKGDMNKLGRLKNLEYLHLCKEEMKDDDLKFVASLPKLRYLEFNANTSDWGGLKTGIRCTDKCAQYLKQASTLEALWIHDASGLSDQFISNITESLSNLKRLDVTSHELTDESLRLLAERCKMLTALHMNSDKFTDIGIRHLKNAKHLKELWLESSSLRDGCIRHIRDLKKLEQLELTVPTLTDGDVRILAELGKLDILAIRQAPMTNEQFALFRGHPNLRSTFLNGSELATDKVLEVIKSIPKLEYMTFGNNGDLQAAVNRALELRKKRIQQ